MPAFTPQEIKEIPILLITRALIKNDKGNYLFIQRAQDDSFDPNLWEIPGGKLDDITTLEETLKREVREEVGLEIDILNKSYVRSFICETGKYEGFVYVQIVYLCKAVTEKVKLSNEHSDFKWLNRKDSLDIKNASRFTGDIKALLSSN